MGTVNEPFSATFTAKNGVAPYTWTADELPAGLTIDASTGIVSGTPTSAVTQTVLITARDSEDPAEQQTAEYSFVINLP